MPDKFKSRSYTPELLDAPNIPRKLLIENLQELDFINRVLGGHAISLSGIKKLVTDRTRVYHIVDLGCGSGDTMKHIANWARKYKYQVKLTGVDINPEAIHYLEDCCVGYPEIKGIVADYREFMTTERSIDILHCSLFCHHLNDEDLKELFSYIKRSAKVGYIINDLHRNWFSYYAVFAITHLLRGSELSKHDGPISVKRAFTSKELHGFLRAGQLNNYSIHWKWAFRYLVVGHTD